MLGSHSSLLQVIRSVPNITLTEADVIDLANDCDKDGSGSLSADELYKAFTQGELAFGMVKDSLGKKNKAVDESNIPRKDVIEFLQEEYETQSALWSLPMTFILFVTFMSLQTIHMQIARSWENQYAVRGEIVGEGPPYLTEHEWAIVHDVPTLWEWLRTSWVSSHFKQPVSEVFPYPGRFVSFNQIIGGVQWRKTEVVDLATCEQGEALLNLYDTGNANRQVGDCHRDDGLTLRTVIEWNGKVWSGVVRCVVVYHGVAWSGMVRCAVRLCAVLHSAGLCWGCVFCAGLSSAVQCCAVCTMG